MTLLAPAAFTHPTARAEGWFVISYTHRITSDDRANLGAVGAKGVHYEHADSYVAWLDSGALLAARDLEHVASVRPLRPRAKIAPSVDVATTPLLDVVVFGRRAKAALPRLERITSVVGSFATSPDGQLLNVVVRGRPEEIPALAADPHVLSIGPAAVGVELLDEGTAQIVAGNIRNHLPVPGYRKFLARRRLDGSGITVAIADSGIDDNHPDLSGRVKERIDYTALPDYRDSDGHGTHVAGIVGGSGTGLPGASDPDGFAYGQGIAPNVTFLDVGVLGIIEEIVGIDEYPPFERVSRFAWRNGAIGWNASWGSGEGDRAGYTQTARTMDIITRDADWKKPGAQPFILVFAAGNSGRSGPGAPTEAKNLIAVASSLSHRAGNIDQISSFSSRGPTRDGRFGPTVSAPGEAVVSTRTTTGSMLCNIPPIELALLAAFYGVCSGTSMAAPHVTGAVALIAQWWGRRHKGATPSAAMAKALLVNSATDMGEPNIPNVNEGWGRVSLKSLFHPKLSRLYVDQDIILKNVGDDHLFKVRPVDNSKPLKVTLAWSDAPAAPNARRALVNDLDLKLTTAGGVTFRGNRFRKGRSVPGGRPDRREVVENVFIPKPSGTYTIDIKASNLPGDGVRFRGDKTDQDFALVVSNAVLASG